MPRSRYFRPMAVVEDIVPQNVSSWFPGPPLRLGLSNSGRTRVEGSEAAPPSLSASCHSSYFIYFPGENT